MLFVVKLRPGNVSNVSHSNVITGWFRVSLVIETGDHSISGKGPQHALAVTEVFGTNIWQFYDN